MKYWLIKSEPFKYSWQQFKKDKKTSWGGVRNYAARNNLKEMQKGDLAFFYHSNEGLEIVGIAKVVKTFYPDPTADDLNWVAVDFIPHLEFEVPIKLEQIKKLSFFNKMDLIRLARLSVGRVLEQEFLKLCEMSKPRAISKKI